MDHSSQESQEINRRSEVQLYFIDEFSPSTEIHLEPGLSLLVCTSTHLEESVSSTGNPALTASSLQHASRVLDAIYAHAVYFAQNFVNPFTDLPPFVLILITLNRTVLLKGLHCPTVTVSPSSTRKAGETCAERFLWRFSYLEYLGMKWRYSLRITSVRCILVETTVPVRMRPRIETKPVNGHFLSMYEPSIAVFGVRKPNPTSLYHLRPPFPMPRLFALFVFELRKI